MHNRQWDLNYLRYLLVDVIHNTLFYFTFESFKNENKTAIVLSKNIVATVLCLPFVFGNFAVIEIKHSNLNHLDGDISS